jgi:hypothetical protein
MLQPFAAAEQKVLIQVNPGVPARFAGRENCLAIELLPSA